MVKVEKKDITDATLSLNEKVILLFGAIAYWGDGKVTATEIDTLSLMLDALELEPKTVIYRDSSDKELCKKERLAWVVDSIKVFFCKDMDAFSENQIIDEYSSLVKDIVAEINGTMDKDSAKIRLESLKKSIKLFVEVDGTGLTVREKKFVEIFEKEIQSGAGCLYWVLAAIIVVIYEVIWG